MNVIPFSCRQTLHRIRRFERFKPSLSRFELFKPSLSRNSLSPNGMNPCPLFMQADFASYLTVRTSKTVPLAKFVTDLSFFQSYEPCPLFVQANFASYLTVQAFKYPITSIEELAIKNKLNYVITSGGATETYFLNSLDPVILALRPRLRVRLP